MSTGSYRLPPGIIESDLLLAAYASGYFPMADDRDGPIHWYSPDPRAIIPLDTFKISRSLRQTISRRVFEIRFDTVFEEVIAACSEREKTWISSEILQSYCQLHRLGYAHSIEAWKDKRLAGGLYGVALGAAFFGESMFTLARDASKVALVALIDRLNAQGFELLDTQFLTPHLSRFRAREIPRDEYLHLLSRAVVKDRRFNSSN